MNVRSGQCRLAARRERKPREGRRRAAGGRRPGRGAFGLRGGPRHRRKLAAANPGNDVWQIDLVLDLWRVGTVSDPPRARAALREALAILEALARDNKLTPAQKDWPQQLRDALAKLPPEAAEAR